ncbi:MAG: aminoglycoside phosphotransferase family protein [Ktedonobacterales bacterium]|nr:aminoglycoside phosphotransferase family protein [Ktedonobacterales bacterium]
MHYTAIERGPDAFQQPLTPEQIRAACARAFGPAIAVASARELSGGDFHSIYLLDLAERGEVILRAAPRPAREVPWHEADLMRREQSIQPYFAPIAPLLPQTLMVDFTHQILDRDYRFQTRMPGESWSAVAHELSEAESVSLMRQMAEICARINSVRGAAFGEPWPSQRFDSWSATVLDWLERARAEAERVGLETALPRRALEVASAQVTLLDEITEPRLLHGDLWAFNVLIERGGREPRISAVLDYDRARGGDPLIDWTFHLLPRRATPAEQEAFWEVYGRPAEDLGTRFRILLYEVFHIITVLADVRRNQREDLVAKVSATLGERLAQLEALRL